MRGGRTRTVSAASLTAIAFLLVTSIITPQLSAQELDDEIAAENAVVVDADTGQVLYKQGMDQRVAPASLTKIFTAIVALESASLDTTMTVDPYDLVGEASVGLYAGEEVTLESLLHGLMLASGNDAAMTIARSLGNLPGDTPQQSIDRYLDRMNDTADRLGLENTQLKNPHGLDQDGHYSSAADIAAITMYALNNPTFRQIISTPYYSDGTREVYNVNRLLGSYEGLIGGKTGITDNAGYSLMQAAQRNGRTVIAVLLRSTPEQWYADAEKLLNFGFAELQQTPSDESRRVIGLADENAIEVPEVEEGPAVGGGLTVDRISDREAVVRAANHVPDDEGLSWQWPLMSVGMMGVAAVVALNFPALIGLGTLAFERSSRLRITPNLLPSLPTLVHTLQPVLSRFRQPGSHGVAARRRRIPQGRQTCPGSRTQQPPRRERQPIPNFGGSTMDPSPAQARAERAIRLALQSRYHAAADEFRGAIEMDPNLDFTNCPGFWRMQPMGYVAAAKAYKLCGHNERARTLITVVQLAFSSNPERSKLFNRVIRALD